MSRMIHYQEGRWVHYPTLRQIEYTRKMNLLKYGTGSPVITLDDFRVFVTFIISSGVHCPDLKGFPNYPLLSDDIQYMYRSVPSFQCKKCQYHIKGGNYLKGGNCLNGSRKARCSFEKK